MTTAPLPVVGVGDSLTSWPGSAAERVAAALGRPYINAALPGTTLAEQAHAWRTAPAGIIVALTGYNDMRRYGCDPARLSTYEVLLEALVRERAQGMPVVLAGCLTMPYLSYHLDPPHDQGSPAAVAAYRAVAQRVAARTPLVVYADVASYDPERGMGHADGFHLGERGQWALAGAMLIALGR